jgi:tetraacyldisaccharide 4'-kinase
LIEVTEDSTADQVGDEPLMFKKRVDNTSCVVVSENRKNGIDYLRQKDGKSIILLDDAFQHRKVQAGYSILLTDFSKPFYTDYVVPMGTLREWRKGSKRADCIIVTKCPYQLDEKAKSAIIKRLKADNKSVFFSTIIYDSLIGFSPTLKETFKKVLLVTGIANPTPIIEHLSAQYDMELIRFKDHHNFEAKDLALIHEKFGTFVTNGDGIIVTTEKDYVRLSQPDFQEVIKNYPWYYQPITIKLDKEEQFITEILKYVRAI